jgi:predicted hotdog family 3-hydroxylacyl-ACP dehydratase
MRLDRAWIEAHIPHDGRMCLLDEVVEWDAQHIRCAQRYASSAADHPLRSHGRLGIACGIEYAAQAMAVHGALVGAAAAGGPALVGRRQGGGGASTAASRVRTEMGFLASLREIRLNALRLDDIETDLYCEATCFAANHVTALYDFALWSDVRRLLSGRATVVLDANKRWNI